MPSHPTDFAHLPWQALLAPYLGGAELAEHQQSQLNQYLTVLLQWNARMNLTAIRDPQEILQRHFGESLFAARQLPPTVQTLLDFGTGAGFPGLPIQIARPQLAVTLAEANAKKVSFLREAIRQLALPAVVFSGRMETLPPERVYDAITMRAVEKMPDAIPIAARHVAPGGWLLLMTTREDAPALSQAAPEMSWHDAIPIPESDARVVLLGQRVAS